MSQTFPSTPAKRLVAACTKADVPPVVWGEPGVSKTATLVDHFTKWGYKVFVVVGSIRQSTDYLGIPYEKHLLGLDEKVTGYLPPEWAVEANASARAVVIFDEFNTAETDVFKAMSRILQERQVGDLWLGDHVRLVAISNPVDESIGGQELTPPIANRLCHIAWDFDQDYWLDNITTDFANTRPPALDSMTSRTDNTAWAFGSITGYLRMNPGRIKPGVPRDMALSSRGWPSPRSWRNLMAVASHIDRRDAGCLLLAAKGLVGDAEAVTLMKHLQSVMLIDPLKALDDPSTVDWSNERPDVLYSLVEAVKSIATSRGDRATWDKAMALFVSCARAGNHDIPIPGVTALLSRMPLGASISAEAHELFGRYVRSAEVYF